MLLIQVRMLKHLKAGLLNTIDHDLELGNRNNWFGNPADADVSGLGNAEPGGVGFVIRHGDLLIDALDRKIMASA